MGSGGRGGWAGLSSRPLPRSSPLKATRHVAPLLPLQRLHRGRWYGGGPGHRLGRAALHHAAVPAGVVWRLCHLPGLGRLPAARGVRALRGGHRAAVQPARGLGRGLGQPGHRPGCVGAVRAGRGGGLGDVPAGPGGRPGPAAAVRAAGRGGAGAGQLGRAGARLPAPVALAHRAGRSHGAAVAGLGAAVGCAGPGSGGGHAGGAVHRVGRAGAGPVADRLSPPRRAAPGVAADAPLPTPDAVQRAPRAVRCRARFGPSLADRPLLRRPGRRLLRLLRPAAEGPAGAGEWRGVPGVLPARRQPPPR